MAEAEVDIRNPSGLHARPAATFVRTAAGFASEIQVTNLSRDGGKPASAKSVLGVMALGVSRGHRIRITAEGDDATAAVDGLVEIVAQGLGEELDGP